jgi:hypothetical protein
VKRARLRTESGRPEVVAGALTPDNTDEMKTTVDGDIIETAFERERTGGLRSTVDDYVVNLSVAERVVRIANEHNNTRHNDQPNNDTS